MPKISVIVPVYKVELYLHRCVDSILAQSFRDFEVILVDDGSPDNCGKICDEYAEKDARVHVIHQENGGLSAARNAGIDWAFANSDSEWLSFVDSDDWVDKAFLDALYSAAVNYCCEVSACQFERVSEEKEGVKELVKPKVLKWDEYYLKDPVSAAVAWNKLYKKRVFTELRYPNGRIHEDEFLTYKLLYQAVEVIYIPRRLYYYYQNSEGITRQEFSLKRLDGTIAVLEQREFAQKIKNYKLYENRTKAAISNIVRNYDQAENSLSLNSHEKKKAQKYLRKQLRRLLITDGKKLDSIKESAWHYNIAFPKIMWIYWTAKSIANKVKRRQVK